MSSERMEWDQPIQPRNGDEEQPKIEAKEQIDWEEYELRTEKEAAERKNRTEELYLKIDHENLKKETVQELAQRGLYEKEEDGHFLIPNYTMIEGIVTRRKVGESLQTLADNLPEDEKLFALNLSSDSFSRAEYLRSQYQYEAKQDDRSVVRRNGMPTTDRQINALEMLRRFDIIGEEELENEKAEILSTLKSELEKTQL